MPDNPIVQEAEKILNEQTQEPEPSTYDKLNKKIIYGKKVVLFAFEPVDLPHFVKLHREDKEGYMQDYCLKALSEDEAMKFVTMLFMTKQIKCWSVYLKQNTFKNIIQDRRAGFIYLTDFTKFSVNISGIMDVAIMKGLLRQIKRDKITFAQDAIQTLCDYLFNEVGIHRITTSVLATNRKALALDRKCGFMEEGRCKEAFHMDGKFTDVVLLAMLNKRQRNEQGEK